MSENSVPVRESGRRPVAQTFHLRRTYRSNPIKKSRNSTYSTKFHLPFPSQVPHLTFLTLILSKQSCPPDRSSRWLAYRFHKHTQSTKKHIRIDLANTHAIFRLVLSAPYAYPWDWGIPWHLVFGFWSFPSLFSRLASHLMAHIVPKLSRHRESATSPIRAEVSPDQAFTEFTRFGTPVAGALSVGAAASTKGDIRRTGGGRNETK
jgi:hypothetical protein